MSAAEFEDFARFLGFSGVELEAVKVGKGLVTAPCPWCGSSHSHGAGEGWRVAGCSSAYAIKMRPGQYRLMPREGAEFSSVKAARRSFAPLSGVNLLARLHPAERHFAPLMRSLIAVALDVRKCSRSPWRVQLIEFNCDGLGRVEISAPGSWFWMPAEEVGGRSFQHSGGLLGLLASLAGSSGGLYAAELLEAFTGFRVSGLSRAALRDFFDQHTGTLLPVVAGLRPEAIWALSKSPPGAALHPLMRELLEALFPRGESSEGSFFYNNARAGVRFSVLRGGRWVGRFDLGGARVRAHGRDVLSLLGLVSGVEGGWWVERILTTALGLDLPGEERGRLAQGLTEVIAPAFYAREGDEA